MHRFSAVSKIFRPVTRALLVGAIGLASVAVQSESGNAKDKLSPGEAAAIGIVGGLALGAILGNSGGGGSVYVDQRYHDREYGYGYDSYRPRPHYYQPRPVYYAPRHYPECYQVQKRVWVRGWGWQLHRRTVCE